MKKKIAAILAAMVLVSSSAAAAWAEERSDLLSNQELAEIESIAQKAYPCGAKVKVDIADDWLGVYATIKFSTGDRRQYLKIDVFPGQAAVVIREGEEDFCETSGVKIVEGIQKILNRSPRLALENILD